jgi:acyl-CoA thioester hydrolase
MTDSVPVQPLSGVILDNAHHLKVRVYYEDTDFSGVVYYANYLKFFERGRSDFLRLLGIHHHELAALPEPLAFAVAHVDVRYRAPAKIDDIVTVISRVTTIKAAQFILDQRIERDGRLLCQARFDIVCIDLKSKPRRLPKHLQDVITIHLSERTDI